MATTRLRIDVMRPLLISDISRFFLSLNAFGIAAEMTGPTGRTIAAAARSLFARNFATLYVDAERTKQTVPEHIDQNALLMQALGVMASGNLLSRETELRISELRTGSIEVVIEDAIEGVSSWFQRLAKSLHSLAPGQDGEQMRTTIEQMKQETPDPLILGAISEIAIAGTRTALENMHAAAVVTAPRAEQARQAFYDRP